MREISLADVRAYTLRPATADDDRLLLTWITTAAELRLFTGSVLTWPLDLGQVHGLASIPGRESRALVDRREPATCLGRVDVVVDGDAARLARVIVAPAHRGRGLARTLVALALADASQRGARRVGLNVIEGNEPALRTYRQAGFRPDPIATARPGVVALTRDLTHDGAS